MTQTPDRSHYYFCNINVNNIIFLESISKMTLFFANDDAASFVYYMFACKTNFYSMVFLIFL